MCYAVQVGAGTERRAHVGAGTRCLQDAVPTAILQTATYLRMELMISTKANWPPNANTMFMNATDAGTMLSKVTA